MAMVTLWLSMARGGTLLSSGMSSPRAGAAPAQANNNRAAGRRRRMVDPFLIERRCLTTPLDEGMLRMVWSGAGRRRADAPGRLEQDVEDAQHQHGNYHWCEDTPPP